MKCLVYQYWSGEAPPYARLSQRLFRDYARTHGLEYRFDDNPTFFRGRYSEYFHVLRPLYDTWFHQFDRVLYLDMDMFPTPAATDEILTVGIGHLAMAEERDAAVQRRAANGPINTRRDVRWAWLLKRAYGVRVPLADGGGVPRIFNSGVILYSKEGMRALPRLFPNRRIYSTLVRLVGLPRFYRLDQNYLGLAAFRKGVDFTELPNVWNNLVRSTHMGSYEYDMTESAARFVHVQVRDRAGLSDAGVLAIVSPPEKAGLVPSGSHKESGRRG